MLARLIRAVKNPAVVGRKFWMMLLEPQFFLRSLWLAFPYGSFELRLKYDIFPRPVYAYGIYHAAEMAQRMGLKSVSVIEFGVGAGRGLLMMERLADEVERIFGVTIEIYGFDTGAGLPPPTDYRDLPFMWAEGDFRMDVEGLKRTLRRAKMILGDVEETLRTKKPENMSPIGFISFDLDYYSSTVKAFRIFDTADDLLPRVLCYFDDVTGTNRFIGELLAIDEFNARNTNKKNRLHPFPSRPSQGASRVERDDLSGSYVRASALQ